jgi:transposase-like protein
MGNIPNRQIIEKLNSKEIGDGMNTFLRDMVKTMLVEVMIDEVNELCGDRYAHNSDSRYRRAGSAPAQYYQGTDEVKIQRPRVRKKGSKEQEVVLKSYCLA